MTLGTSTLLIAIGAIMRYAVTVEGDGFDIPMIGGILMIVGVIGGLVSIGLFAMASQRRTTVAVPPRAVIVEEREVV
jgi:hypothetical protein